MENGDQWSCDIFLLLWQCRMELAKYLQQSTKTAAVRKFEWRIRGDRLSIKQKSFPLQTKPVSYSLSKIEEIRSDFLSCSFERLRRKESDDGVLLNCQNYC